MAYFHQQRRRRRRRRISVRRVSLIITLYYAELFPLVRRERQRWRLSLMVTVPILGMDLHPRDRSPFQFYYILIRGLESISTPVKKPAQYNNPCGNPSPSPSPLVEISHYCTHFFFEWIFVPGSGFQSMLHRPAWFQTNFLSFAVREGTEYMPQIIHFKCIIFTEKCISMKLNLSG